MKRSNVAGRCFIVLMALTGAATFSASAFGSGQGAASLPKAPTARAIKIVDQNGRPDPGAQPSATSQIFDVAVGPGGSRSFSPSTVNIAVGDTVRWTWGSDNHSVTSGNSCAADSQFCSPGDMDCPSGLLSNSGAVYQHTFGQAGTYFYFCAFHCFSGMTGTVNVAPACAAPPANMAAWYPGDGNGRDIAGGNNGSLQNGTTFAPGKVGQAFSFDGADDQIVVPHNANQNGGTAITIDAWINLSASLHGQPIANKRSAGNIGGYTFETTHSPFGPDNSLSWVIMIGGVYKTLVTPANVLTLGTFQHVAATYDGAMMRIYVDGVEKGNMAATGSIDPTTDPLLIGRNAVSLNIDWHGLIDELEIFNRALSATEIAAIFNAGAGGKCKPIQPTAAFSRKTHGAAGPFDIDLLPFSTGGVECRSGGASGIYQMIVQFANPVTVASASLIGGSGSVSGFSVTGATVTVDLMNITNAQRIFMRLTGVNDGVLSGNVPVAMSVLVGDTTGNGAVSASDVSQAKLQSGQPVSGTNFRNDIGANGSINATDVSNVKLSSGTALPP
jgi:plastocyanin